VRKTILAMVLLAASAAAGAATIEMKVNGLVCAFCAQGIEKTLKTKPAVDEVIVSLKRKMVVVTTKKDQDVKDEELKKALTESGYEVKSIARDQRTLAELRDYMK
jgi:copper chaperone CopZ